MFSFMKKYSKLLTISYDILSIPIALYFAYWLRDNMQFLPNPFTKENFITALYMLTVVQLLCNYHFKVYRGLWRFVSINDAVRIIRSTLTSVLLFIPIFYLLMLDMIPRSILPLYSITLITLLCGGRLVVRLIYDRKNHGLKNSDVKKILIVGAGQAGEGLLRELKRSRDYLPIGFIDDNAQKHGLDIHGVRVLGSIDKIPSLAKEYNVDLIFIAIASASSILMRRVVYHCEKTKIPFRTLPSMQYLTACQVNLDSLRNVNIEDLLGRDQVHIEFDKIFGAIQNKRILVTGGGGSIGSELCRQIVRFKPKKLLILDCNEFNLYSIENEFRSQYPNLHLEVALISVTDKVGIDSLFNNFKPEIVFHAAAYKHVPMLEGQIRIAINNNVIGTKIVAEASVRTKVAKFILISTDKAVNPTNVMGASKRVAEIYCQNLDEKVVTQFITVRFGNVLGSTGSVVPLFQQQLMRGGPLTVTDPNMQRYFMTIPEASQLILQATANGNGGEIFVLDMGEPVKIKYLAEQMIRLAGLEVGKDIEIKYTGLRPGEKLYEELFHSAEILAKTDHAKLFKAQFRKINWDDLSRTIALIELACNSEPSSELLILLKSLVPEFVSTVRELDFG